jgi:hypothetical protein
MKYLVEIQNGIAKETLVFNGKEYARTTEKTYCGSSSNDLDLCEQMENDGLPADVLDQVYDTLDGFFIGELLDIAESEG